MRCVSPFVKAGEVYPCGQCLPCKFKARRVWFHRLLLEASQHDYSSVVTLTYDEAACPQDKQLSPDHLTRFIKRIRKRSLERYPWRYLRFYAVAEYGERTQRPHYHLVLFGYPGCEFGRTGRQWCGECSCVSCSDVSEMWPIGAVSLEAFSRASAAYVAGYVSRKVLSQRPPGKRLPFTRQSNRPGIGANAVWDIAHTMLSYGLETKSLPTVLAHGRGLMPLGRYLRSKLSAAVGQEIPLQQCSAAVQSVLDYAFVHSKNVARVFGEINEPYSSQLQQREALKEKVI